MIQYVIKNKDQTLFGPNSFDEVQKEFEENLESYRDHGYDPEIEESKE